MSTIAIIPARGGSKGIPRKNLIDFSGKPLIYWSIIAAKSSDMINDVYVSSDSEEILELSKKFGAKQILRPSEISGDTDSSELALIHALNLLSTNNIYPENTIMLQVTSPLRKKIDLDKALNIFKKENLDSLFSSSELIDFLIWEKSTEGEFKSLNYDWKNRGRRQDREPQYVENGSFYIFKTDGFKKYKNRFFGKIGTSIQDLWQSFELDEPSDIEFIKLLFEKYNIEKEFK